MLFGVEVNTINYHLKEIFKSGELIEDSTIRKIRIVQQEGNRSVERNVDSILKSQTSTSNEAITKAFFKTVQNKLHWAITGHTAAELIAQRADASKPNMGLKTWKNAPQGKVLKGDIAIAKNYLEEQEIKALERVVSMYLDFAENQAARQIPMKMADWVNKLDAFLQFNEYDILKNAGKVSHEVAKALAEKEYSKFRVIQDKNFESDFEKEAKRLKGKKEE